MAELKQYRAVVNGMETVLNLTEEQAKARGLTEVSDKKVGAAATPGTKKAAAPADKGAAADSGSTGE